MSFLIECPNCGPRDVAEFRYGGQILASSFGTAALANAPAIQDERWYHRFGCRRWLHVQRDVRSNHMIQCRWLAGTPR